MKKFKFITKVPIEAEYKEWFHFYGKFHYTHCTLEEFSYFDSRPQINITATFLFAIIMCFVLHGWWLLLLLPFLIFGWGEIYINLPFDTGEFTAESGKEYGFYFCDPEGGNYYFFDQLVICYGDNSKYVRMPWSLDWYRTSYLLKDGTWHHNITKQKKVDYWSLQEQGKLQIFQDQYKYTLHSGEVQTATATYYVSEREWRRHWCMAFPLFNSIQHRIEIDFSKEIGEGTGEWKGGVVGCSWDIKKGQTPQEALKDMEANRKFKR